MPIASPQQKRAALESHRELGDKLEALRNALRHGNDQTGETMTLLDSTLLQLEALSEYLSATVQPRYYNEIIPLHSTAAQRTFAVPELLAMILTKLDVPSIVAFAATCREYKANIDNSPQLQTALCLRPAPADKQFRARFRTCLAHFPGGGFFCKPPCIRLRNVERCEDGETCMVGIVAVFFPQGDEQRLPRIGPTWRRMFVTQPPIKEMTVRVRCCGEIRATIEREAGITIGDLYDANAKYIEEHRWCPFEAHGSRMLENGQVQVLVDFAGKLTLKMTHPLIRSVEQQAAEKATEDQKVSAVRRRNGMYRSAKLVARDNGQPIPTLSEWLEMNPQWKLEDNDEVSEEQRKAELDGASLISVDAFSFN